VAADGGNLAGLLASWCYKVTLPGHPDGTDSFYGFDSTCAAGAATCDLTMNGNIAVTANFGAALTVAAHGKQQGQDSSTTVEAADFVTNVAGTESPAPAT
jgi:hypothetical protein